MLNCRVYPNLVHFSGGFTWLDTKWSGHILWLDPVDYEWKISSVNYDALKWRKSLLIHYTSPEFSYRADREQGDASFHLVTFIWSFIYLFFSHHNLLCKLGFPFQCVIIVGSSCYMILSQLDLNSYGLSSQPGVFRPSLHDFNELIWYPLLARLNFHLFEG